jgi:Acetyltransferase (GNAT) family
VNHLGPSTALAGDGEAVPNPARRPSVAPTSHWRYRTVVRDVMGRRSRTRRGHAAAVVLPACDGVVTLRPPSADRQLIVDERDEECERWLGPGSPDLRRLRASVNGHVVGWIDADPSPEWLQPDEANIGYSVSPAHRGNGYGARAVCFLAAELDEPALRCALLVIDVHNHASAGVA